MIKKGGLDVKRGTSRGTSLHAVHLPILLFYIYIYKLGGLVYYNTYIYTFAGAHTRTRKKKSENVVFQSTCTPILIFLSYFINLSGGIIKEPVPLLVPLLGGSPPFKI